MEYYVELLNKDAPEDPVGEYPPSMDLMAELSVELIQASILSLKNNKAAGTDGMTGELLKYGSDELK